MERVRLAQVEQGAVFNGPLLVLSATARETKTRKPYLVVEFFDGYDKIQANYWDWAGNAIPKPDTILSVVAQKGEYMGTPQLTIKSMVTCSDFSVYDFAPQPSVDINTVLEEARSLLHSLQDKTLQTIAANCLDKLQGLWLTVPGAVTVHHAYMAGTLIHCVSCAKIAQAIARNVNGANEDLCVVGALLHDLGKLFTYKMMGAAIDYTDEGQLFEHTFIGANFISNFCDSILDTDDMRVEAKIEMLVHIILSHHGKLEHGASVPPCSIEAFIVSHADGIDASAECIRAASTRVEKAKWTERIWSLGNKPCLCTQYVQAVMAKS